MLTTQAIAFEVSIDLPTGASAQFQLHGQSFSEGTATCFVVKDAGDDPDITNGAEVHALVSVLQGATGKNVDISGGRGIGIVTKPGLAIPPGEWAINPIPRKMIEQSVHSVQLEFNTHHAFHIEVSIPDGEERAKKTLNARLGIMGGLSILGTTGIVRPISAKAWTDTIDASIDVAKACNCPTVVLSTGRSSEMAAQQHLPHLPEEAFIMMGDHVAYALQACSKRGFNQPIIACQFAKLLKIACGYKNTHAAASELDLAVLHDWAHAGRISQEYLSIISKANTAREIAIATGFDKTLMEIVANRARHAATVHALGIQLHTLLCGYDGTVYA